MVMADQHVLQNQNQINEDLPHGSLVFKQKKVSVHLGFFFLLFFTNKFSLDCLKEDRVNFNGDLIHVFVAEYTRSRQNSHIEKPVTLSDKMITDWKFAMLDSNHNRILEKYEYRELKRIVKKVTYIVLNFSIAFHSCLKIS